MKRPRGDSTEYNPDKPAYSQSAPLSSTMVTTRPLVPTSVSLSEMPLPERGSCRAKGPADTHAGTKGLLEKGMQTAWPHVFFNLEMAVGPPALCTPLTLEMVETPEPLPRGSSSDTIGDEIVQRVNWYRSSLEAWKKSCARYHHLLRERDQYIQKLREHIVNEDIYIGDLEWSIAKQRRDF